MCLSSVNMKRIVVPKDQPLIGYRGWAAGMTPVWIPSIKTDWAGIAEADRKPSINNENGLHCFKTIRQLRREFGDWSNSVTRFGRIKIWGTVVEHPDGYRAEFASFDKEIPRHPRSRKKPVVKKPSIQGYQGIPVTRKKKDAASKSAVRKRTAKRTPVHSD